MRFLNILLLIGLFGSCSSPRQPGEKEDTSSKDGVTLTAEQIKNAEVEVDTIRKKLLSSELKVHGLVDVPPQNIVSISFPLGGYLKNTRLLPGLHVSKGEMIAVMEDRELIQLQQDYLIAKTKLSFLEKEYERQKTLNENKISADKNYQQTEADYFSQKVLVKGYSEKLRLIGINPEKLDETNISRSVPVYSPINGFVSKVNINIGKYVNAADVLFELINPDDIHAVLTVFEKDLGKIKPKQKVMVTFVDDPQTEYECEVLLITKNVDDNRSALVHCHFEKEPKQLLPGMFLNARIEINSTEVNAVPESAVVRYSNGEFVIEQREDNYFHLLPVQTGIRENGFIEIKNDEIDFTGKKVIVKNAYTVLSQMKNTEEEN
ncbi:MAG: efflux RND transporter periplasmic adaptor subunit [Chitinophagaceae bacterium]|nr:efflux RND transporter periplasmic adaptor subunit [Chitinophagaceae bacterium]